VISSFCGDYTCVQVDPAPGGGVYVQRRVVGDGAGTVRLPYTADEWRAFVLGVKAGEFDDLVAEPGAGTPGKGRTPATVGQGPPPTPTRLPVEAQELSSPGQEVSP
jgi:hypothetical protein